MEVLTLLCVFLISWILFYTWGNMYKRRDLPPGPTPLPFIGNLLQLKMGQLVPSLRQLHQAYGEVYTLYLGTRRVVILCGYDAVKEALIERAEEFGIRGRLPTVELYHRGDGVVFSNGDRWKALRRFSVTTLRNFGMGKRSIMERIQDEAGCLVEELKKTKGEPFVPTVYFTQASANIICSIIFGNRFSYDDPEFSRLICIINDIFSSMSSFWGQLFEAFEVVMKPLPGPHHRPRLYAYKLEAFIKERIKAEVKTLNPEKPRHMRPGESASVVFSNGDRWKALRRFSVTTLRNFGMGKRSIMERIQDEAGCLVEELKKTKGEPFVPTVYFTQASANIICSIIFGNRFSYDDPEFSRLICIINDIFSSMSSFWGQLFEAFEVVMKPLPGPHHRPRLYAYKLEAFIKERIKAEVKTLNPEKPRHMIDSFLSKMEEEKQNPSTHFNMDNFLINTNNLFNAGTETISSTLRHGFLILLKYPDTRRKVQEEIDRVIGRQRAPESEDRISMPYTDAVIHEIQRYANVLPMNLPHTVNKDTQFRGFTIPKGTDILPMLEFVLRDAKYFPNPDNFDPTRFLDENGRFKKNEAFLVFSAGKRACLGESLARSEIFIFLTTLLQHFNITSPVDPKDLDISPQMVGFSNIPRYYRISFLPR